VLEAEGMRSVLSCGGTVPISFVRMGGGHVTGALLTVVGHQREWFDLMVVIGVKGSMIRVCKEMSVGRAGPIVSILGFD